MPELPEVEIVMRRLRDGAGPVPSVVGARIDAVQVPSTRIVHGCTRAAFTRALTGATITGARRRAKHILVETSAGTLALHLRMTGDIHVLRTDEALPPFTRLTLSLAHKRAAVWRLAFVDGRHLGTARLFRDDDAGRRALDAALGELGPEPLERAWDVDALASALTGARPVKAALLDQTVVAGVGNIYADESLFRAQIAPTRKAGSLTRDEVTRLHAAIKAALSESIQSLVDEGAMIAWRYQHRESESPFLVYDRAGEPCTRCGATLVLSRVAGRATVTCPRCQGRVNAKRQKTKARAPVRGAARPPSSRGGTRGPAKKQAKARRAAK